MKQKQKKERSKTPANVRSKVIITMESVEEVNPTIFLLDES